MKYHYYDENREEQVIKGKKVKLLKIAMKHFKEGIQPIKLTKKDKVVANEGDIKELANVYSIIHEGL